MTNFRHTKLRLFARSRICGICHKVIEHVDDANVDHIIPRYYGGRSNLKNLRLTHSTCNEQRGHNIQSWHSDMMPTKAYEEHMKKRWGDTYKSPNPAT